MSDELHTIPIRQSTVDEVLRVLQDVQNEVRALDGRMGNLETEVRLYKDKVDSDIKGLRNSDKEVSGHVRKTADSVTDLRETMRLEQIAMNKGIAVEERDARKRVVSWVAGIVGSILVLLVGVLLGKFVAK